MEHALTRTAAENDADFLARVSPRWAEALDQDGAEPSEEAAPPASRAPSSANPGTACTTWKSSPPPTSSNTSSPS